MTLCKYNGSNSVTAHYCFRFIVNHSNILWLYWCRICFLSFYTAKNICGNVVLMYPFISFQLFIWQDLLDYEPGQLVLVFGTVTEYLQPS